MDVREIGQNRDRRLLLWLHLRLWVDYELGLLLRDAVMDTDKSLLLPYIGLGIRMRFGWVVPCFGWVVPCFGRGLVHGCALRLQPLRLERLLRVLLRGRLRGRLLLVVWE